MDMVTNPAHMPRVQKHQLTRLSDGFVWIEMVCSAFLRVKCKYLCYCRIAEYGFNFLFRPNERMQQCIALLSHLPLLIHHCKQSICQAQNISIISSWYEYVCTCHDLQTKKKTAAEAAAVLYDTTVENISIWCTLSCFVVFYKQWLNALPFALCVF